MGETERVRVTAAEWRDKLGLCLTLNAAPTEAWHGVFRQLASRIGAAINPLGVKFNLASALIECADPAAPDALDLLQDYIVRVNTERASQIQEAEQAHAAAEARRKELEAKPDHASQREAAVNSELAKRLRK